MEDRSVVRAAGIVYGNAGGTVLLVRDPDGKWRLPEVGRGSKERLAPALERHLREEYGLPCVVQEGEMRWVTEPHVDDGRAVVVHFEARASTNELQPNGHEVRWVFDQDAIDLAERQEMAFDTAHILRLVTKWRLPMIKP